MLTPRRHTQAVIIYSRVVGNLGRGPAALTSPTAYHWPTCRTGCEGTPTAGVSTTQPTDILHTGVASNPTGTCCTQPSTAETQMQSYDSYDSTIY